MRKLPRKRFIRKLRRDDCYLCRMFSNNIRQKGHVTCTKCDEYSKCNLTQWGRKCWKTAHAAWCDKPAPDAPEDYMLGMT